ILADLDMTVRMERLPKGVKSLLDKSIYDDAVDMSGGEKQKIAIARALYKASSLIILDEPTAALDPLAEAEIYESFNELVKDQTAIYISHRMSSSIFCDKILLLQDGEIAAFDSHENLKKSNNLYSELFLTQAAHYQRETA
ncbi:MAG: ATP-binding cassette domain-containing protein, partial [Clostridiales bacterium]|nr:ATP-binding cassette domain-containing protein [Clostridiales bacterium]